MWNNSSGGGVRPVELNATAASLLGFLHSEPRTGWELARDVEQTIGDFWNVTRSQIYRELRTLAAGGLVEAGEVGARDRRPYAITDAGRSAFSRWIMRAPGDDVIRSPLLLTVFFGEHLDEPTLARFLRLHRAHHEQRLAEYEALYTAIRDDPAMRWACHALEYGIAHERAVREWMDALPWLGGDSAAQSPETIRRGRRERRG